VTRHRPHRVSVTTRAAAETFLVLGDVHYPGWEARLDGRPARLYRTDYALRGVVVPAGTHVVEFVFRPRSFYCGVVVSGAAVLTLLALGLLRRRRGSETAARGPAARRRAARTGQG